VSFNVTADAYHQFMGRYSEPLATEFADWVGAHHGQRALDVGSGPGALTDELVTRLGVHAVAAIDPSEPFVASVRARYPQLDVHEGVAEHLPFADDSFDLALAELGVHFMKDPVAGLQEMARVTQPGGTVAACVWDHAGGSGPLSLFWRAVRDLDPDAEDESNLAGSREGYLAELFETAGLHDVAATKLTVSVPFASLTEWWEPYNLNVGPAGAYVAKLSEQRRDELRERCAELLPPAPFELQGSAWTVLGRP
jgi:SAM-dependent methyltransferase